MALTRSSPAEIHTSLEKVLPGGAAKFAGFPGPGLVTENAVLGAKVHRSQWTKELQPELASRKPRSGCRQVGVVGRDTVGAGQWELARWQDSAVSRQGSSKPVTRPGLQAH